MSHYHESKNFWKLVKLSLASQLLLLEEGKKDIKIVYKFPKAFYPSKIAEAVENLPDKYKLPESVIKC